MSTVEEKITRNQACYAFCNNPEPHEQCEQLLNRVDAVTEPGWKHVQVWVSAVGEHLVGDYSATEAREATRNRSGVMLAFEVFDADKESGYRWEEQSFTMPSGSARSLAALLVRAADIHEGLV